MPQLPARFRDIVDREPLPLSADGADVFESLSAAELTVIATYAIDLLGNGMGPALVDLGVRKENIRALITPEELSSHPGYAAVMRGERALRAGDSDADLVRMAQRAIQAVSARVPGAPAEMHLDGWGCDGGFGSETQAALTALDQWLGTSAEPVRELRPDQASTLLRMLEAEPVPDLWMELPVAPKEERGARRLAAIAVGISESSNEAPYTRRVDGRTYRYTPTDFGVRARKNGFLRAPGGVAYQLDARDPGFWKCNIFGGTVVALAELPVPTFPVGRYRHFPRAERFGERLAQKPGWKIVRHLDHRDPQNPIQARLGDDVDREVAELLLAARPGDVLFVDHPGEPGENGGHTRICTAAAEPGDPDIAPTWAQSSDEGVVLRRDGLYALTGGRELQFWLLRYRDGAEQ